MKKNYTLKLVLAMLVVVLVSLVSFVGVYKGKNLLKEYSLGKDFSQRKVASYSVVEPVSTETQSNEQTEAANTENATGEGENNQENSENNTEKKEEPLTQEQKTKNYNEAKNNIFKRLTAMKSGEFDIRLNETTGKMVVEVPSDINSTYLSEIVSKGKVQIKNSESSDVIAEGKVFSNAEAILDKTSYEKTVIKLNMEFTKDVAKKIRDIETKKTDDEGNQTDIKLALSIDGETLYSDTAATFVSSAEKGKLELVMSQNTDEKEIEEDYQRALAITAIIKYGEIPVEFEINSLDTISSNISIKTIAIISVIVAAILFVCAVVKFKLKAILPMISIVGLIATVLLALRYTNVKITLFTVLGLAIVALMNYVIIWNTLENKKPLRTNLIGALNIFVPCIITAIVFCCAPFVQLASFGMAIFWGILVMCTYNLLITRVLIDK